MYALRKLTLAELRLFLREPVSLFFTVLFPGILVTVVGKVWSKPDPALGGLRVVDLYISVTVTLIMCMIGLQFAPQALATYRERGVLRRMATTPVHPAKLLVAQLVTNLLVAVVSIAVVLTIGRTVFGVALPKQVFGFALALVLAAAAIFAIGLVIAALAPTGKAGGAIGGILFFPMMFFAGLWVPREVMGSTLRQVSDLTPLGAGVQALKDATAGSWPTAGSLLVLTAYLVVFGVAAVRLFRWE